jgi:tetratricopeptide (TPR) repeat protein
MGRPLEAERLFRRAIEISRADQSEEGVSPMLLNNYGATLDELARLDEASGYAERAYARARQAGDEVVTNQSLFTRARIYQEQHDFARGLAMLDEVEPRLRKNLPPGHYAFASLFSVRSLLELERGDLRSALSLANQAVDAMEATAKAGKAGSNFLPTVYLRRAKVELQASSLGAAAGDVDKALDLLQKDAPSQGPSAKWGRAYLLRARVCKAQGKDEEARAAARSAVQHLESTLGPDHPDTRSARQLAGLDAPTQ